MIDPDAAIDDILTECEGLPDTPFKVGLLEEAARIADAEQDVERGYEVRVVLIETALEASLPDRMTVAFSWCLAQADRDPASIDVEQILWQYRWVIHELTQFPQVPRAQIEEAIVDMTRRYRRVGSTLRGVHMLRMNTYLAMNDFKKAKAAYRSFKKCRRDIWSDDPETEKSFAFSLLCNTGTDKEIIAAQPKIMGGKKTDPDNYAHDATSLLFPLLNLGRVADALRIQKACYRDAAKSPREFALLGTHLHFFARLEMFSAAVKVFEKSVRHSLETKLLADRAEYHADVLVLMERLRRAGHNRYKMKLPTEFPVSPQDGMHDLRAMVEWIRDDLARLGSLFDARNGNTYYADLVSENDESLSAPRIEIPEK